MRALVVLPSYNESQNIVSLVDELLDADASYVICVVDDSSPDGTSGRVAQSIEITPGWSQRVHLMTRGKKDGRGGAVREGLGWGLAQDPPFDAYAEMDCDFSHEPGEVPRGFKLVAQGYDAVIGARYPDGTIIGWPRRRRIFSRVANGLARRLIEPSIGDYTNGFRFYSPRAVRVLVAQPQLHTGYIYLTESLVYLLRAHMRITSFPICFRNRERGVSNTGAREIGGALTGLFAIAWNYRRPRT